MSRAQSEAVGTVLLLAMVVIAVSVVGSLVLGTIGPDDSPTVDVEATVTDSALTLTHRSGESLPGDELTVVLRYEGTEERYDFATDGSYGADNVFAPGEEWRLDGLVPYAPGDRVEVLLLHDPSNTVLFRGRKVAATPTATATPAPDAVGVIGDDADGGDDGDGGGGADGGDGGGGADGGGDPTIQLRIDDLTDRDTDNPHYVVSYDVGPANDSFDRVEVSFASDAVADTGTETGGTARGSVEFDGGYGANAEYSITVRTYYAPDYGGTVVGSTRTITDRADTINPSNDDLSEAGSPSLRARTTITDRSDPERDRVQYRFDYDVETNGNFGRVLLGVINRNGNGGTTTQYESQSSRKVDLRVYYGATTEYKATILVFDDAGAVVDERTLIDTADGT